MFAGVRYDLRDYPRDEDHLALCMELLGPIPHRLASQGRHSKTFFNRRGQLRHIKNLRHWGELIVEITN